MAEESFDRVLPSVGQRIAVFLDDAASGATLGYYGEFLGLPFDSSSRDWTESPYRVFVPFLKRIIDVAPQDVFVPPRVRPDEEDQIADREPLGAVRFDVQLADDNQEIRGFYRIGNSDWGHFLFLKTSRSCAAYEYSAPVEGAKLEEGILFFEVPRELRLDRTFVLRALTEIMGVSVKWNVIPDSSLE